MSTTPADKTVSEEQSAVETVDEMSDSAIVSPLIDMVVLFGLIIVLSLLFIVIF